MPWLHWLPQKNVGVRRRSRINGNSKNSLGWKRRLEVKGEVGAISVYSDFAHHPTAITVTLAAIRAAIAKDRRIIAVVDICSNTMRAGVHKDTLGASVAAADMAYFFHGADVKWDVDQTWQDSKKPGGVFTTHGALLQAMLPQIKNGDLVLLMSNGAFESFAKTLLEELTDSLLAKKFKINFTH